MEQEESIATGKPHILVVDDSRLMRVAIKKILKEDYQLTEVEDGEYAWQALDNDSSIQIVITDLNMPNMDGFTLLEKIRSSSDERLKELPVIIITGNEDDEATKKRALDCGASDFVTKPFDSVQLKARTKNHIHHHKTSRKLTEVSTTLEEKISIDTLTGLANKRQFFNKGQECISFSRRHHISVAVIRIEIDRFDHFFIKYGRQVADNALKTIANILLSNLRKEDTAARIGLSKFALILVNSNPMGVSNLARRIQSEICEEAFNTGSGTVKLTASLGVVCSANTDDPAFDQLVMLAEKQLSHAISTGGNTISFASEVTVESPGTPPDTEDTTSVPTELNRPETSGPAPDLETAVQMLGHDEEKLVPHLKLLLKKMVPLLRFCNERMGLDIDEMIEKLEKRL